MVELSELQGLISKLWQQLHSVQALWQLATLGLCLGLGALLAYYCAPRTAPTTQTLSRAGLQRLLFPLSSLLLVLIAKGVLLHWYKQAPILNLASALLIALALIRSAAFIMRHTFASGPWLLASERWLSWAAWLGVIIYSSGLWPVLREALQDIGFSIGKYQISLLLLLQGGLAVTAAMLIALWLGRVAEARIMNALSLQINLRVMFTKLIQFILIVSALLLTLPVLGIDLTVLSVFGGMLGVGLGFGLQKIAANYVSSFIILIDRAVSIGDLVTIGSHTGTLTKMTARYVVVRHNSGLEAIIPNETIITSTVFNHTYSDRRVHIAMPVQIAYNADLELAKTIMLTAAHHQHRALREPEARVFVLAFADHGLSLELSFWVEDSDHVYTALRSAIYTEIWHEFRNQGIEIPYPQRDIRLISAEKNSTRSK